jgi:hypothetical protein
MIVKQYLLAVAAVVLAAVSVFVSYPPTAFARNQSATQDCVGTDAWLIASEDRFRPFGPLFDELVAISGMNYQELAAYSSTAEDTAGETADEEVLAFLQQLYDRAPEWAAASQRAMQEQAASQPPRAAVQLNAQIVSTLGTYVVVWEQFGSGLASIGAGSDDFAAQFYENPDEAWNGLVEAQRDVEHSEEQLAAIRGLSRDLKRVCGLTESGAFFDAGCYGDDAYAWYLRTNIRVMQATRTAATPQEEAAQLQEIVVVVREQKEDVPPPTMSELQGTYLSFLSWFSSAYSSAIEGSGNLEQLQMEGDSFRAALNSRKASLDIACLN